MTKYGMKYNEECLLAYFRAFNYLNNGVITFPELLMGLACIDSKSCHNEIRSKFVVRYYDVLRSGYLYKDNLRLMIQDMCAGQTIDDQAIETQLNKILQDVESELDQVSNNRRIHHRKFVGAIGEHKIRGTSKLCRIGKPICACISNAIFTRSQHHDKKISRQLGNVIEQQYGGSCVGCRAKRPILEDSLYKLNADGLIAKQVAKVLPSVTPVSIQSTNTLATAKTPEVKPTNRNKKTEKKTEKSNKAESLQTTSSVESIAQNESMPSTVDSINEEAISVAHQLLKQIHDFAPNMGNSTNPAGLLANSSQERSEFLEKMTTLQRALEPLLKRRRWVPVASPAIVIGDLHGNLADLLTMEKSLWKRFPAMGPNLVFLGDMVDRGKWSVECVAYLLCLMVIEPDKVTVLRGNHEVRDLQRHYSYQSECLTKYGTNLGQDLWTLTNAIFDLLPLCAVIDGALYGAHGGIPRQTSSLEDIAALPVEISNPQEDCQIAWEILWADPMGQSQFIEMAHFLREDIARCQGFLHNKKRGTAYAFAEEACNRYTIFEYA